METKKTNQITETTANINTSAAENQPVCMCGLCFAATCSSCGYYAPDDPSSGWCRKHGGWVSPDKWACSDYV